MTKAKLIILGIFGILMLGGCVHPQMVRVLDQKLKKSTGPLSNEKIGEKSRDAISESTALSPSQKTELFDLQRRTQEQLVNLNSMRFKLRDVLIADIAESPYNQFEVDEIERRLDDLERTSLNLLISAVDKARNIVGNTASYQNWFIKTFGFSRGE